MPSYSPLPFDRVKTKQVSKAYVHTVDQELLARTTFLTDIRQPMMVIQDIAPKTMFAFLASMSGGISTGDQPFRMGQGTTDRLVQFWDVRTYRKEPGVVIDNSLVPATATGGQDFDVTMTGQPFYQHDQIMAADGKQLFFVKNRSDAGAGRYKYTLQLIANNKTVVYNIGQFFEYGKTFNYIANMHPEASTFGRGLDTGQTWRYFNNTQVIRRSLDLTGHAESDASLNYIEYGVANEKMGIAPLSSRLVQAQMEDCHRVAVQGRGNYDPITGSFTNQNDASGAGKYSDIYSTSGFLEQWESTTHVDSYWLNETAPYMMDKILAIQKEIDTELRGGRYRLILFGGDLAEQKVKEAFMWYAKDIAVNRRDISGEAGRRWTAGFIVDAVVTEYGEIVFFNYERATKLPGEVYDQFQVGPARGTLRSGDIFAVPIFEDPELAGDLNMRIFFKSQNVPGLGQVNRALSIGTLKGMTGAQTGKSTLGDVSAQVFNSLYQVNSPVDADTLMLLTEFMPIYSTPDKVWWLQAFI